MADPRTIAEAIEDQGLSTTAETYVDVAVIEAVEWIMGATR